MTPHETYCQQMKDLGIEPTMDEAELHKAWGIKPKEEEHIPIIARKSSTARNIATTFENNVAIEK